MATFPFALACGIWCIANDAPSLKKLTIILFMGALSAAMCTQPIRLPLGSQTDRAALQYTGRTPCLLSEATMLSLSLVTLSGSPSLCCVVLHRDHKQQQPGLRPDAAQWRSHQQASKGRRAQG